MCVCLSVCLSPDSFLMITWEWIYEFLKLLLLSTLKYRLNSIFSIIQNVVFDFSQFEHFAISLFSALWYGVSLNVSLVPCFLANYLVMLNYQRSFYLCVWSSALPLYRISVFMIHLIIYMLYIWWLLLCVPCYTSFIVTLFKYLLIDKINLSFLLPELIFVFCMKSYWSEWQKCILR